MSTQTRYNLRRRPERASSPIRKSSSSEAGSQKRTAARSPSPEPQCSPCGSIAEGDLPKARSPPPKKASAILQVTSDRKKEARCFLANVGVRWLVDFVASAVLIVYVQGSPLVISGLQSQPPDWLKHVAFDSTPVPLSVAYDSATNAKRLKRIAEKDQGPTPTSSLSPALQQV